ncbi:beta-N-acetylhexosaminidase [Gemmatimonadota bacterium]
MKRVPILMIFSLAFLLFAEGVRAEHSLLWREGISLIPYPQQVESGGEDFVFGSSVTLVMDPNAGEADRFAAEDLAARLKSDWGIEAHLADSEAAGKTIVLTHSGTEKETGEQGYRLATGQNRITIRASSAAGLFYGTRTLLQIIQQGRAGPYVKGMSIVDRPHIAERAVHYDTKHFQEKRGYVEEFIRTLADYKINMLIWEWEDKFAYQSHPEIGAPGAFTIKEMQELTRYARKYHIQLVPLVQGLGHASYILKWPQHASLRELPASNWQFCPYKEGTYKLMFDLLEEAIEATPGSEYIHIGCDESYELGRGVECGCLAKSEQIGKYSLRKEYIDRCTEHLRKLGRKVMVWDWPDAVLNRYKDKPVKGLTLFGGGLEHESSIKAKEDGYRVYFYDPNPGIEHLFLPYYYRRVESGRERESCTISSYKQLTSAALSGIYRGMVSTSWNCSGAHNQVWMLRYITGAEYSWSGGGPSLEEFREKYFKNYYGPECVDLQELFQLLNRGAYYYMDTFGRKVWHWGYVEKVFLPDLPRGDAVEYDPFWNREYAEILERSREQLGEMERALKICRTNKELGLRHSYDFELFASIAGIYAHTCRTYLALSELESAITQAHRAHFTGHSQAYRAMERAAAIIERSLADRERVFGAFTTTWEKTQLPRGMSTPDKKYFHATDRGRNFINRRPDLSTVIYDEQRLDLEGYLKKLKDYMEWYKESYL